MKQMMRDKPYMLQTYISCPKCKKRFWFIISLHGPMVQWGCDACAWQVILNGANYESDGYNLNGVYLDKKPSKKEILEVLKSEYEFRQPVATDPMSDYHYRRLIKELRK